MGYPIELEVCVSRWRNELKKFGEYYIQIFVPPHKKQFYINVRKSIHGKLHEINMRFPTEHDAIVIDAIINAFDRAQQRVEGKLPPLEMPTQGNA